MRRTARWNLFAPALAAGLVILSHTGVAKAASHWRTDFSNAEAEAKRDSKLLLLHFHASWCGPCRQMDREVLSSARLAQTLGENVIAVKIDSDRYPQLIQRFQIRSLPSDVFLGPDGRVISRTSGYQPAGTYLANVSNVSARFQRTHRTLVVRDEPKTEKQTPAPEQNPQQAQQRELIARADTEPLVEQAVDSHDEIGLEGFCPVTLWSSREWKRGREDYAVTFHGITYHLAGAAERDRFREAPQQYAPKLLGCDPVVLSERDLALPGDISWGAFYDGELYLFQTEDSRRRFKKDPQRYSRTRHVLREEIKNRRI